MTVCRLPVTQYTRQMTELTYYSAFLPYHIGRRGTNPASLLRSALVVTLVLKRDKFCNFIDKACGLTTQRKGNFTIGDVAMQMLFMQRPTHFCFFLFYLKST